MKSILLFACCFWITITLSESFTPPQSKKISSRLIRFAMPSSTSKKTSLYPWREARRIARGHGFQSKEEFLEYSCAGAYQVPKNPDEVWKDDWKGWDDWLGISWDFAPGREIARALNVTTKEEYMKLFENKLVDDDEQASRLPYRPDLKHKAEWKGWEDWLR
jgi:hypothetical protein